MTWSMVAMDATKTLLPVALAAATGLLAKGAQYALHAVQNVKNKALRTALDNAITEANNVVDSAVVAANQTVVTGLKSSGQWTAQEAKNVFAQVLASVKTTISTGAMQTLHSNLPDVEQFLSDIIQQAVALAPNKTKPVTPKAAKAAPEPVAPANPA